MRKLVALSMSLSVAILLAVFATVGSSLVDDGDDAFAANETTVRWGSFTIPAGSMGAPAHLSAIAKDDGCSWIVDLFTDCIETPIPKPCSNCYITSMKPDLVLAGTDIPVNHGNMQAMGHLHHVVNFNFSDNDPTCPPGLFGGIIQQLGLVEGGNERFFASGNERSIMSLPPGYGYRVNSGDDWGIQFHLMNMMTTPMNVEFKFTFTWVTGGVEPVQPIWFDIDQCNDSELPLPAGYSDTHKDWNSTLQGTIVAIGGHVHDRGISIALQNASTGRNICTSVAGYAAGSSFAPVGPGSGADANHPASHNTVTSDPFGLASYNGHISDMTQCQPFAYVRGPRFWGLIPGQKLRVHTQYNRPNASEDDMGIMIAYMDLQ